MTTRANPLVFTANAPVGAGRGTNARPFWSTPNRLSGEARLAPCMARPNLFSGD